MKSIIWRGWAYLFLLVLIGVAFAWQLVQSPSHEERDIVQERLQQASPPLTTEYTVGQTFISRHAGLKAIEFLVALYRPDEKRPASARILLTLERLDDPAAPPVAVELGAAGLEHNQRLRFPFSPLADSRNVPYRLTLSSNGDHAIGLWLSAADAYASGELLDNGSIVPGDLYFVTIHDYCLRDVLADVGQMVRRYGRALPALLLLLCLPGLVITLCCLPPIRLDLGTHLGLIVAASVVTWPLLLLWTSTLGTSLAGGRIWAVVGLLLTVGLHRIWAQGGLRIPTRDGLPVAREGDHMPEVALIIVLVLTLAVRLLQVRELVVPAWVDSVHHTLITQMISELGAIPSSCEPYLPIDNFHYHFGFHANAAILTWLSGLPPHQAVLLLGQVFNAVAALSAYALATSWSGRRWAGVGAATVVGCLSYMPAYYASWGRYTQLTGLLILPLACMATIWLLAPGRRQRGHWVIGVISVAGLVLTHYRVLVFYATFWLCYPLLLLWRERGSRSIWARLARVALVLGCLVFLVSLPWVGRLLLRIIPNVGSIYGGWFVNEELDTSFPTGLLNVGWTRQLLIVAGVGAVWGLVRRRGEIILIPIWVGLWLLVANLHLLGLRDIWLVHNSSVVISFWLPMGVLCGWLLGDLIDLLVKGLRRLSKHAVWEQLLSLGAAGSILVLAGWGSWRMVDVVNPVTVLTTPDDIRAIEWARDNLPGKAYFLINTRQWQGELRAGSDGGYWLPILAKRAVNLPCVLYHQGTSGYREAVNDLARTVEEAESLDVPELRERLEQEGITHVFVGGCGGRLMPKELDPSPYYQLRYSLGPVRIYEFVPNPE